MDHMSDADLVALARTGDRDAFGELAERHSPMARRVAYRMIPNADAVQEIAQEAIVQAYLSVDKLKNPNRFQSWLYGIVLNLCRRRLRDRKWGRTLSYESIVGGMAGGDLPMSDSEPGPQEVAEARELARTVRDAVDMLSPSNRAATLMYYFEQLTVQETALHLGISVTAVKGRLHKSRNALREILEPLAAVLAGVPTQTTGEPKVMVKVTIADVLAREHSDDETNKTHPMFVVVLKEVEGNRAFPIWVGPAEGEAIVMGLKDIQAPRPMTHNFMANLLDAAGVELEEVRVQTLQSDTFIGVAKIRAGDVIHEVDARPSDIFALAVRTDAPIYVAEDVIDRTGVEIPLRNAPTPDSDVELVNMDQIAEEMINAIETVSVPYSAHRGSESAEEATDRMKNVARKIIGQVFGGSG